MNFVRPFLHNGIDFTGYLWIEDGRKIKKMYILICFNVRALHMELVDDISAHVVVLALVRFFKLYGVNIHIYSDNSRFFVAVCNFIKQVFILDEFDGEYSTFNIKHLTITGYSAWFVSVW